MWRTLALCVLFVPSRANARELSSGQAGGEVAEVALNIIGGLDASGSVTNRAGTIRVEGQLKDDRSIPREGQLVVENTPRLHWEDCLLDASVSRPALPPQKSFATDSAGHFCLQAKGPPVAEVAVLARASQHETTRLILKPQTQRRLLSRIVRAPDVLLAGSAQQEEAEALIVAGSAGATDGRQFVLLLACPHRTQTLASASGEVGEVLRFSFTATNVTTLGRCRLLVSEERTPNTDPSAESADASGSSRGVLVRAPGVLSVDKQWDDRRGNVHILVKAELPTSLALGPPSGLLQATSDQIFVGSCPLHGGSCELILERGAVAQRVEIRLVPDTPEVLAGEPLIATVPARSPSSLPFLFQSVLLAGFGAWLLYAWIGRRGSPLDGPTLPLGSAGVSQGGPPGHLLEGIVLDAHTGEPIAGSVVELIAVHPREQTVIEVGRSDARGAFSLTTQPATSQLLRLRVGKVGYLPVEALVQGSRLIVQITAHRRALISSLLRWAKAERMTFHPRIPGPHQIAVYAESRQPDGTGEWAQEVERAAYGREAPAESDVTELSERQRR